MNTDKDNEKNGSGSSRIDQAIDCAFERTNESTGASPLEIFCAGLLSALVGLVLNNADVVPAWLQLTGSVMIAIGLIGMIGMAKKV